MEYLADNWQTLVLLLLQGGFLKFAYKLYRSIQKQNIKRELEQKAMESAIRCLLRGEIISLCHKSQQQGYIAVYNLENLNEMYDAYHRLGGNGSISEIYQKACLLPNEPGKKESAGWIS